MSANISYTNQINKDRYMGRGKLGIRNMGNTCYLNSVLQCLKHVIYLSEYFVKKRHLKEMRHRHCPLIISFAEFIEAMVAKFDEAEN